MNESPSRLRQLDGLRALAVMGVIFDHATTWTTWLQLGPFSVRLFFVLSGFLITGILLRARAASADKMRWGVLRAFYARRFLRIFPVYYASLFALYVIAQPDVRATIGWHALYLSNVLNAIPSRDIAPIWGHLWSLSVEEQFYLIWPAVILFTPSRRLPIMLLSCVATAPVFRLVAQEIAGYRPAFFLTPGCLDSLGLGAFLAWLFTRRDLDALRVRLCQWALYLGFLVATVWLVVHNVDTAYRFRVAARDVGPALLFFWLVNGAVEGFPGRFGKFLELKSMSYIAAISYGMYLFHGFIPPLFEMAGAPFPNHGFMRFLLLTLVTFVVASVSWHFFEKPLNDLKDHFPYVRRTMAPTAASAEPKREWSVPANT